MFSEKIRHPKVSVLRLLAGFMLLLVCLCQGWPKRARAEGLVEQITGVVVAYDDLRPSLTCIESCETSFIVRLDSATERDSSYIRVDFKFRDRRNFPKELISGTKRWHFKVIRTASGDEKLEEFVLGEDVHGKSFKNPIWRHVPGAEAEKLPFGAVLRSYSLMKRGFKLAGD